MPILPTTRRAGRWGSLGWPACRGGSGPHVLGGRVRLTVIGCAGSFPNPTLGGLLLPRGARGHLDRPRPGAGVARAAGRRHGPPHARRRAALAPARRPLPGPGRYVRGPQVPPGRSAAAPGRPRAARDRAADRRRLPDLAGGARRGAGARLPVRGPLAGPGGDRAVHDHGGPGRASGAAFAIRVEAGGASLVYSGDTGPTPALVELTRGADLALFEASCLATWTTRRTCT